MESKMASKPSGKCTAHKGDDHLFCHHLCFVKKWTCSSDTHIQHQRKSCKKDSTTQAYQQPGHLGPRRAGT